MNPLELTCMVSGIALSFKHILSGLWDNGKKDQKDYAGQVQTIPVDTKERENQTAVLKRPRSTPL